MSDGFKDSRTRTAERNLFWQILGELSTARTAATLIAITGLTTWIAAYYERDFGMAAAHVQFYQAWWFNLIFIFMTIAVVGAVLVRIPLKRQQTGFVIVHVGLVLLIAGFWLGGNQRLDGMLNAWPGREAHQIELPTDEIRVVVPGDERSWRSEFQPLEWAGYPSPLRYLLQPFSPSPDPGLSVLPTPRQLAALPAQNGVATEVYVTRVVDTGAADLGWLPAPGDAAAEPATRIDLALKPPGMTTYQDMGGTWLSPSGEGLFSRGPLNVTLARTTSTACVADFLKPAEETAPDGRLIIYWQGKRQELVLERAKLPQALTLDPELSLTVIRILTNPARDTSTPDGGLVQSDKAPPNPVVELAVRRGQGPEAAIRTVFISAYSLLPPVPGMPDVLFSHPQLAAPTGGGQGAYVQLLVGPDGQAHLRSFTRSAGAGVVTTIPAAGWSGSVVGSKTTAMDLRLSVQHLAQATPGPTAQAMRADRKDRATRWLELEVRHGSAAVRHWFARGEVANLTIPGYGDVRVGYQKALYDLKERHGFAVVLDHFEAGKDPGGMSTASYVSDVTVVRGDARTQHRISMNEPLHVGGVTLYQTAFFPESDNQGQPTGKDVSVFTVAQDQGRILKYLGSLVLVLGIVVMYRMRK